MNWMKVRPSCRCHTVSSFNENGIFHRKLASRECVLQGPKIDFGGGLQAVPCPWQYGPGFSDCGAVGPWVKNSKMFTALGLPERMFQMARLQLMENNCVKLF